MPKQHTARNCPNRLYDALLTAHAYCEAEYLAHPLFLLGASMARWEDRGDKFVYVGIHDKPGNGNVLQIMEVDMSAPCCCGSDALLGGSE